MILIAVADKQATTIAEALFERVILVHGTPQRILSDREAVFSKSEVIRALTNIFHIKQVHTSAYHPQSNGNCERVHRFINSCMKCMCQEISRSGTVWDRHLECIAFAYNTSKLDFADFSPHYMLYGKAPTMPDSCRSDGLNALKQDPRGHVSTLQQRLAWATNKLTKAREELKEKNKSLRDKAERRYETTIKPGSWVMIQREHVTKGLTKTQYQFSIPYKVSRQVGPTLYELEDRDGKLLPERYNVARLVEFTPGNRQEEDDGEKKEIPPQTGTITLTDPAAIGQFIIIQVEKGLVKGEQWRLANILEARASSRGRHEPDILVHFHETYRKNKDISKRQYMPAFVDTKDGKEIYTPSPPEGAEPITDLVGSERCLTTPFTLNPGRQIPPNIIDEITPSVRMIKAQTNTIALSDNPHMERLQDTLENLTKSLNRIEDFPTQLRNNYAEKPVEGFILGLSRTYDLATQHLRPAAANNRFPEVYMYAQAAMRIHDPCFTYTSIQVNRTGTDVHVHKDAYNKGNSYIIALGEYIGGNLWIGGKEIYIHQKFLKFDGSVPHKPLPHRGTRYSLVYFTAVPKIVDHNQNHREETRLTMNGPLQCSRW